MDELKKSKKILVTGGSRGIGSGIVEILAKQGYHVIFTYNSSEASAHQLKEKLLDQDLNSDYFRCDVSNYDSVSCFCEYFLKEFGPPYGIVYNAGIALDNLHFNTKVEEWKTIIDTNLNSVFYFNKHLLSSMLIGGGNIITISSVTAERGNPGQVCYGASKAALKGLTKSLAKEVGRFNVRVNSIAPGFINTDMLNFISNEELKYIRKGIPLGRIGQPSDVGYLVGYLMSKEAEYITGQTIIIDGGLSV
jgi:3-oxoacyl-[acyl-carrier protein] reductase